MVERWVCQGHTALLFMLKSWVDGIFTNPNLTCLDICTSRCRFTFMVMFCWRSEIFRLPQYFSHCNKGRCSCMARLSCELSELPSSSRDSTSFENSSNINCPGFDHQKNRSTLHHIVIACSGAEAEAASFNSWRPWRCWIKLNKLQVACDQEAVRHRGLQQG